MSKLIKLKAKVRLPSKPSKLIRLALADLEEVESNSRYEVDAGSVMVRTLKAPFTAKLYPQNFSKSVDRKLNALNEFRNGHVGAGLISLGLNAENVMVRPRRVPEYKGDGARFKKAMRKLADDFESVGL
jgi:hypothetical protein